MVPCKRDGIIYFCYHLSFTDKQVEIVTFLEEIKLQVPDKNGIEISDKCYQTHISLKVDILAFEAEIKALFPVASPLPSVQLLIETL